MRMYVSDVVYGGEPHTFTIAIEAQDQATLDKFAPAADRLIAYGDSAVRIDHRVRGQRRRALVSLGAVHALEGCPAASVSNTPNVDRRCRSGLV